MAGVYVHVPFCHSKCAYCDFYSRPVYGSSGFQRVRFASAVASEMDMRHEVAEEVRTVYIGGGTPSILPTEALGVILDAVMPAHGNCTECTIEANPEDVTEEKAAEWRALGFNRVSMGVQSMVDDELTLIGRRHSAADVTKAVDALHKGGFSNISLDLIYGLPSQTAESFRYSLERILDMAPMHLSAYLLSYEPRTRLTAMLKSGRISETDEDTVAEMYDILTEMTAACGFEHYEISNFARPGFRARHNSSYWDGTPYIGLGPGAHSFDGSVRRVNAPDLQGYLAVIESGHLFCEIEDEDEDDRFNDMLITALRTSAGLDLDKMPEDRTKRLIADAARFLLSGDLELTGTTLRIPPHRWLVSDAVMRDLLQ